MIEYLLKASIIIGVALLFYKCLLQQETFFKANRIFFIVFLVLAFLMPLVSLPQLIRYQGYFSSFFESRNQSSKSDQITEASPPNTIEEGAKQSSSGGLPTNLNSSEENTVFEETFAIHPGLFDNWLLVLYLFGVVVFTFSLLFQAGNIILKILRSQDNIEDGQYVIVNLKSKQAPCSFFNYIFICPEGYEYETYEQIIAHEKHHASSRHSLDLILAEIAVIALWFNPLVWLYKREIEKNLEYDTDYMLLHKDEVSKDQYQLNLLQIAVPNKPLSITTNYNQSLLKQRILMMNSKKSNVGSYWKYSFIAPLLIGTLLFLNKPASGQITGASNETLVSVQRENEKAKVKSAERVKTKGRVNSIILNVNNEDISQGFWYSYQTEKEYCIDFKGNSNPARWSISNCFDKTEFTRKDDNNFSLKREAGMMQFTGQLGQDVNQGKYTFTKESSFENYLAQNDLVNSDKNFMFHLFIQNVTRKYVDDLRKTFQTLNGDQLLAMAIHRVGKDYIEDLSKAGFKNIEVDKIVEAKIHGVTSENIKEMKGLGFGDLGLDEMISLRIHDVNAKYISELKTEGFSGLDLDQIVEAKIHGVNAKSIRELQALGFDKLSMGKIIELRIHGVDASYVADLKNAGFPNLRLDEIIQAKIHGVTSKSIREIKALGFNNLSFNDITELKLHDVDVAYISELKEAGFKNLSKDQVLEAKIHGVDAASIKEIQSLGYKDLSLSKIVEAQIHGVDGGFLENLKSAGIKILEFNDVIEAKIHGVDGDFIKESRKDGYDYSSVDEYINLKIHGIARNSRKSN